MVSIIERIEKIRKANNLNQAKFSARIKITQSYFSRIIKNERKVNDRLIALICAEFDISETWLRTGAGEMFAAPTNNDVKTPSRRETLVQYILDVAGELSDENRAILLEAARKLSAAYPVEKEEQAEPGAAPTRRNDAPSV